MAIATDITELNIAEMELSKAMNERATLWSITAS